MAFHATILSQADAAMVAVCFFDADADNGTTVSPGDIAHGLRGLPANAFSALGSYVRVTLSPIIGEGAPVSAALFYAQQYFVVALNATSVRIGKTAGVGLASTVNCCQVVVARIWRMVTP